MPLRFVSTVALGLFAYPAFADLKVYPPTVTLTGPRAAQQMLLVDETDLSDRVLPAGRLREPLSTAVCADAALFTAVDDAAVARVAGSLGLTSAFRVARSVQPPCSLAHEAMAVPSCARVFAIAGIARPDRFFSDLSAGGWHVTATSQH